MEFYGTLGGLCRDRALLVRLFRAGMTGARLNLSHTSLSQCSALLEEHFFPAARQAGVDRPHLIIDLQGPELRLGTLPIPIPIKTGDDILLGQDGLPVPPGSGVQRQAGGPDLH